MIRMGLAKQGLTNARRVMRKSNFFIGCSEPRGMITPLTQTAEDADQSQAHKTNKPPSVVCADSMQEIVATQGPPDPATLRSVIQDQDLGLLAQGADYLQPLLLGKRQSFDC
jgi:hypothetical protein